MTRRDLGELDIEIRQLYFTLAAELRNPVPPQLCNTDGDPIALTTLTYELKTTVGTRSRSWRPLPWCRAKTTVMRSRATGPAP